MRVQRRVLALVVIAVSLVVVQILAMDLIYPHMNMVVHALFLVVQDWACVIR